MILLAISTNLFLLIQTGQNQVLVVMNCLGPFNILVFKIQSTNFTAHD